MCPHISAVVREKKCIVNRELKPHFIMTQEPRLDLEDLSFSILAQLVTAPVSVRLSKSLGFHLLLLYFVLLGINLQVLCMLGKNLALRSSPELQASSSTTWRKRQLLRSEMWLCL